MSKFKFRIFVPFMILIIFAFLFLLSFILTSFSSTKNTFKVDRFLDVNLYEMPNEIVMEFQYLGIRDDVQLTFDPNKLYFEQHRTFLNLIDVKTQKTSTVVMPAEYTTNGDGTITYNPKNNPLRIVLNKEVKHTSALSSFFFKFAPSPTFYTPFYEFTLKEKIENTTTRFSHVIGGYNEYVNEVSPITNELYVFVNKMFIKENRSLFVGKSPTVKE